MRIGPDGFDSDGLSHITGTDGILHPLQVCRKHPEGQGIFRPLHHICAGTEKQISIAAGVHKCLGRIVIATGLGLHTDTHAPCSLHTGNTEQRIIEHIDLFCLQKFIESQRKSRCIENGLIPSAFVVFFSAVCPPLGEIAIGIADREVQQFLCETSH